VSAVTLRSGGTPTGAMIRSLGVVSVVCGLIIVGTYEGTLSAAQANRRIATERAVFKVVPGAKSIREFMALPDGMVVPAKEGDAPPGAVKFYAGYDGGKLVGIAAEGAAKGYADTVRVMFGYTPQCQCITGIGVVSMRETPGIGDKILTNKEFIANFRSLDVHLTKDLSALANEVKVVKHGTKTKAWEIDAISGATVTSRAVGKGINDAARVLLPKLAPNIEKIRSTA
jgi:H+/Na+-translocating ferredoxin:NAD+ oxidoreductase subunit G